MDRSRVGIVIPALNEAATLVAVLIASSKYGVPIVVDDGSTDATAELALSNGAVVVTHEKSLGYDEALNSGFIKAAEIGCEVVVTVDADGQHDPSLIQRFMDSIDAGANIVIGVRSRRQRFAEHLFAWYTNIRFGIEDPLCGMKAYRITIFKALGHFDSYGSIGTELMIFAATNGESISQISFDVRERQGRSKFGAAFALSSNYKIVRAMILSIR